MQKLTILDIATLSGVGKSTVSRVLNQDPKVSKATREKVLAIIEKHQFTPSRLAQNMRSSDSKVIGIIVTRLDSLSENSVVREVLPILYQANYDVLIMESQFDLLQLRTHLTTLNKRNVDGLIIFGFTGFSEAMLDDCRAEIIIVSFNGQAYSSVRYDNYGAITLVMDYLYNKKLRQIAYIGVDSRDVTTGQQRLQGYLDYVSKRGLRENYSTGELSYLSGYSQILNILDNKVEAVVCATDTLALGAAKKLHLLGLNNIIVTGIGGGDLLKFMFPDTVSVDLGYLQMGKDVAHLLLEQLNGSHAIHHLSPSLKLL